MSSHVVQNHDARTWSIDGSPKAKRLAFVVAVSLLVVVPVALFGIPSNVDLSNHFRFALPFRDGIVSGNLYPGWLAESNGGYGDPSFRFYPPALYYLLSIFRFVTGEWYVATLLTFGLISVVGGLGIYLWARSVLSSSQAMWAGLVYAVAPYHLNQLYQATMLAEWAGSAVLPFAFAFVERVCADGKRRDVAGLAVSYALLVLTHLPLTVIGSIALAIYALVRIESGRKIQTLLKLSLGAALGLCASSIYWVTMVSELRWIGLNEINRDASVDYRFNFLLSTFSPDNLNVWWMNILALMTVLLSAPVVLLLRRNPGNDRRPLKPVVALTAFALFMSLPLSRPIWALIPALQQTQFPWRWLALISMGIAILTAAAMPLLNELAQSSARIKRLVLLGAMSISVVFTLSHVVREAKLLPRPEFEKTLAGVRGTPSVNYWFPIWASSRATAMDVAVDVGNRTVAIDSWATETDGSQLLLERQLRRESELLLPALDRKTGEQLLATRPDKDGALLISLPANALTVDLVFNEPRRSRVSSWASLAGFVFIGTLALPFSRRKSNEC